MKCCAACDPDHEPVVHVIRKLDASGEVVAIGWSDRPVSPALLEADIARLESYARSVTSLDDVVYRSRPDQ